MAAAFNLTAQINLQGPTNLKPIVSKIKKDLGSIKTNIDLDIKPSAAKNIASINTKLKELSKLATNANASVKGLNSSLSGLANSFTKLANSSSASVSGIENTNKAVKNTQKALSDTTTEIEEFGKQSGLAIRRFAAFSTVTSIVYGLVNAFSSAFKEFVNFDREIVRLSQVTGESTESLRSVGDEITRLSVSLGVASSDLLTVATTLAQAGLSAADTRIALEALAKSSLAPSFDNLTDTTEGAIAVLRQFGLEASDLEGALGSINEVSAAFAVEAGDLITAIQRTGGVFASSSRGVSEGTDALNEFLAIFTSIRQTTRESAETIATGLRTIFTRVQREDTIKALRQYGVELTDLEGKFVGPFEATKRLSEGLGQLDPRSLDFSRITEELGGFRQIGKVIPLIQQFAVAQEALKVAQRGQDSLAEDAAVAQESLANRFIKTQQAFQALVRDIGNSGTFRALAEVVFGLADSLIAVTAALEPLLPLLTAFAAIKIGSSLTQFFSGFGKGFGGRGGGGLNLPTPTAPSGGPQAPVVTKSETTLVANTSAVNALLAPLNNLLTTINATNQTLIQTNALLKARPISGGGPAKFARGGLVPGSGSRDTVHALLTPGEFVIRKKAVQALGLDKLTKLNRYSSGGQILGNAIRGLNIFKQDRIGAAILDFKQGFSDGNITMKTAGAKAISRFKDLLKSFIRDPEDEGIIDGILNKSFQLLRKGISPEESQFFDSSLRRGLIVGANSSLKAITNRYKPSLRLQNTRDSAFIENFIGGLNSASIGNLFETIIDASERDGIFKNANAPGRPFDFTSGIQSALSQQLFKELLGITYVDAKSSTDAARPSEMANKVLLQVLEELRDNPLFSRIPRQSRFARGGGISGQDIVPALLTPGEFVINKRAAQRIGYHNLRRLNHADKVKGYNKGGKVTSSSVQAFSSGGTVQRFAEGGQVSGSDLFAIGAILTTILQPQVEKLASSFVDANGQVSAFAAGLSGAIREVSSLVGSSLIGLSAVGANRQERLIGGIGAGIGGGVGGALTEGAGQALAKALESNTLALSKFDKLVIEAQQQLDPVAQKKASAEVQKSFAELAATFDKNQATIETSAFLSELGKSVTSATTTFLVLQTSLLALAQATNQAAAAQTAKTISDAGQQASGASQFFTNLAASVPGLVAFGGGLIKVGAFLARFAGVVGIVIGGLQLVYSVVGLFSSSTKKASEENLKFAESLKQATKNNNDFSLNNSRFSNILLKKYQELDRLRTSGQISNETFNRVLSSLSAQQALQGTRPGQLPPGFLTERGTTSVVLQRGNEEIVLAVNELNSTFRTFITAEARNNKLVLDENKGIIDGLEQLRKAGLDQDVDTFIAKFPQLFDKYLRAQFDILKKASPNLNLGTFEQETATGVGLQRVVDLISDLDASTDRLAYTQGIAQQTALLFSNNLARATDLLGAFDSRLSGLLSTIEFNNKNLLRQVSLLEGQPAIDVGADRARLNAQIISNLRGFDPQSISDAVSNGLKLVFPPGGDPAIQGLEQEFKSSVDALRGLQQALPSLLSGVSEGDISTRSQRFEQDLTSVLETISNLPRELAVELARGVNTSVQADLGKGNVPTAERVLTELDKLGGFTATLGERSKILISAYEAQSKVLDIVTENTLKYAAALSKSREIQSKQAQTIAENANELAKILGQEISTADLDKVLEDQIRALTGGPVSVSGITESIELLKKQNQINQENIRINQLAGQDTSALVQQQGEYVSQIASANSALELIINSGANLRIAFDKLIEKEKQLFSGPKSLLFRLLQNPQLIQEIRKSAQSTQRLLEGRGTAQDLASAPKLIEEAIQVGNRDLATAIENAILKGFIDVATRQGGSPEQIAAARSTLLPTQADRNAALKAEIDDINRRRGEIDKAYASTISAQLAIAEVLGEQGIIKPLNNFNNELNQIIPKRIAEEERFIAELRRLNEQRTSAAVTRPEDSALKATVETLKLRAAELGKTFEKISLSSARVDASGFGGITPRDAGGISAQTRAYQQQAQVLNDTNVSLEQFARNIRTALGLAPRESQTQLEGEYAKLRKLLEETENAIRFFNQSQPKPQERQQESPPSLNTSSLKVFQDLPNNISTAIATASETFGANLISQLNGVFGNFNSSVATFKSSADKLVADLDNFNSRGGIKGPAIPQEVAVRVSFNEDLTVIAQNTNTQNILDSIAGVVSDSVRRQLNNVTVFGRA